LGKSKNEQVLNMRKKTIGLLSTTLAILLLNTGCSMVGPDYKKPQEQKLPTDWDANLSRDDKSIKEWWKLFNDETLNTLVEKSYEQNLDLRSAALRILQSRAVLGISEGLMFPQVQSISGSAAAIKKGSHDFGSAKTSFDVGWEMDIWGKYARGIESSEAILYASIASYDDILVTIIAEVARNYINYTTAQERIAFAKRNIEIQTRVTKMTEVQFNAGNVSELDMQQSKAQLYATKSLMPNFELMKIKSRNALAVLLGILPQEVDEILNKKSKKGDSFIPNIDLKDDFHIDADLIRRRPDLRVAELKARSQNAKTGMAEAELYPHFSLFGSIGYSTNDIDGSWMSAGDAIGISAGPAFSWNIFQYGRIKNQIRVQDALFQESLTNYNKKVLQAVEEVSNSLNGYKLTKKQLKLNAKAINATKRAYELSVTQYENGLVTYQRLLSTVESLTRNEDAYAQIKGNISIELISLYKALGGGWQLHEGPYLHQQDIDELKSRGVDWGEYLKEKDAK
jgi:NodT family efflux transporter outer membrane factor (OMF) lipoprotein